jgi:hypothetical protein
VKYANIINSLTPQTIVFLYFGFLIDQVGLEPRDSPASAFQVLGLYMCAITPGIFPHLLQAAFSLEAPEKKVCLRRPVI